MHFEILWPRTKWSAKGKRFVRAAIDACPHPHVVTERVAGRSDWLLVYGGGGVEQRRAIEKYPGRWVHLDLGYWQRAGTDYPIRCAINSRHQVDLPDFGPGRQIPAISNDYCPTGRVIVVGMGRKSKAEPDVNSHWERDTLEAAFARFGKRLVYRPKPGNRGVANYATDNHRLVQQALKGAALVITRHSNVGVDAIIQGIPVSTEGGAASWLYSSSWDNAPASVEDRIDFLKRLAWWQWKPSEAGKFWEFITDRCVSMSDAAESI